MCCESRESYALVPQHPVRAIHGLARRSCSVNLLLRTELFPRFIYARCQPKRPPALRWDGLRPLYKQLAGAPTILEGEDVTFVHLTPVRFGNQAVSDCSSDRFVVCSHHYRPVDVGSE